MNITTIIATLAVFTSSPAYRQEIADAGQRVALPKVSSVQIVNSTCPSVQDASCVISSNPTTIYFDPDSDHMYLIHELAHVYDLTTMPQWQRVAFMRIIGYKRAWANVWNGDKLVLPGGAELFADAYMSCAVGGVQTVYGWYPTNKQYKRICHMLRKR